MGNFLRTIFLVYMETISCQLFVEIFTARKKNFNMIGIGLACVVNTIFVQILRETPISKLIVGVGVITLFVLVQYGLSIIKSILVVCGYYSIMSACDLFFLVISEKVFISRWYTVIYSNIHITLLTFIIKLIEFIVFAWLNRIFSSNRVFEWLNRKSWFRFLLFSTFSIIALMALWYDVGYDEGTVLTISMGLILLNVMFYFTMWDIANGAKQNQEYQLAQEKIKGQMNIYKNMESAYGEQRRHIHEFKNHIGCIQGLLQENKYKDALQYVNIITNKFQEWGSPVKTGNNIVDTIIKLKYGQAIIADITMILKLDCLQDFPLRDEDAVVLFSNLFDNALEACEKIEDTKERIIKFNVIRRDDRYIMTIKNRTKECVDIKELIAETTKTNKQQHGVGMQNIKDILRKYHADSECCCEMGWFTYTVILKCGKIV